ncbi:hypothetical protein [Clostridium vincentii]|uniref:Uncharacterized protein n=1 Tax=Clostridium vincentii TaxID=52704 RepID=A0A2T0BAU0_9CLOT|nr:hypothetical protein [Clostridium vincentii]PRR80953.1 hypothetical protein CLVI_28640 [Clostridium vincentii]
MKFIPLIIMVALSISFVIYGIKKHNKSWKYAGAVLIIIVVLSNLVDNCDF